jgi:hypothetical protein
MDAYKESILQVIASICFVAVQILSQKQCHPKSEYWEWLWLV